MPPTPKHPSARARRNTVAGARTLRAVPEADLEVPELPPRKRNGKRAKWLEETLAWWRDLWASPMAPEFDDSDRHGLVLLAILVDEYHRNPTPSCAAEIRLQRQCYGLTPIDRRRLQWEIDRGEESEERTTRRRAARRPRPAASEDPRAALG